MKKGVLEMAKNKKQKKPKSCLKERKIVVVVVSYHQYAKYYSFINNKYNIN
jgi:hypothetical protein